MEFYVYSKKECPACDKAEALLKARGFNYQKYVLGKDYEIESLKDLFELLELPMPRWVPQIFVKNGNLEENYIGLLAKYGRAGYVGGYPELETLLKNTGP